MGEGSNKKGDGSESCSQSKVATRYHKLWGLF